MRESGKISFEDISLNNLREFHRRIVVIEDPDVDTLVDLINRYHVLRGGNYRYLISGKEGLNDNRVVREVVEKLPEGVSYQYLQFKDLNRILGTTWDMLIIDLRIDMRPNDVGRLIEVVRGGGIIFLLAPDRDKWKSMKTPFHHIMVTSPYTIDDVKTHFLKFFVESLEESPGIFFLEGDGLVGDDLKTGEYRRVKPDLPRDYVFDERIYQYALTQDQVAVINSIDRLSRMGRGSVLIIADRGRGKSASIGLGIAGYMVRKASKESKIKVLVSAPDPLNCREVFSFIRQVFKDLNVKHNIKRSGGDIIEINSVLGKISYVSPPQAFKTKADLVVVDEASAIPTHILTHIAEKFDRTIFSSTLHGYEGAGRGFQIRFLPLIRSIYGDRLIEVHMREPIRYAPNDPIERWLFKTFFLDADPYKFNDEDFKDLDVRKLRYKRFEADELLFKYPNLLREYIGIYIYAHYRNRPNDIMILSDAPHHFIRLLTYKGHVINSLHLAYEGLMSDKDVYRTLAGDPPSGHVIPTILIRYYPYIRDIAWMRGIRIVRIATHPDIMRRGVGSEALKYLQREAEESDIDWLGASFGATIELLDFWWRNGYSPLYLSPVRNPVSGEFSTVVVKPLSGRAKKVVKRARLDFKKLLMETLLECHFNLDPKLAYQLLSMDRWVINYSPRLDGSQKERLKMYIYGGMAFGGAFDAIREVVKTHFMRSPDKRVRIPRQWEYVLINRILQARPWEKVAIYFDLDMEDLVNRTREIIAKLRLYYVLDGEST